MGSRRGSLVLAVLLWPSVGLAEPHFTDRSRALGLTHSYQGGWEHFVGGGVATFDCDGDHFADLYVAGGSNPAVLLRNRTGRRGGAIVYEAETPEALALSGVIGAYPLDIDSDGILDLAILRVGENRLFKGGPDCRFRPFSPELGFDGGDRWSTAFSATFEPGNLLPTLAIGNYVDRDNPDGPFGTCDINVLHRPQGDRYGPPLALAPGYCTLSMLFSDWGRKGRQDLRVSNDRHYYVRGGSEQLWAMEPNPRLYDAEDGWRRFMIWGMGIASRDITGDGIAEIYLTSMGDQKLQSLETGANGPAFSDATYDRGTTAHRPYMGDDGRPSTGWHAAFGDVQNDGLDDIFVVKGNVEQMPSAAIHDPNTLLIQHSDGRFREMGDVAGIGSTARGRGGALADLNLDGRLDLVVVNRRAPIEILQNQTAKAGNWLLIDLRRRGLNTRAVGAWIEVRAGERVWHREVTVGGGHASGQATFHHFGLGTQVRARLRVIWPDGVSSEWREVTTNQILKIVRDGKVLAVSPL